MRIRFYGPLAEAIGREVELPGEPGGTLRDVRRRLIASHPSVAEALARPAVRACLDDEVVGDDTVVPEGAELAFLPPLSGG
jgi:molybdopterin synthase sulfur carrier subunit